ncbi:MAG: AAA family ATPase [Phormidesmis sp.]
MSDLKFTSGLNHDTWNFSQLVIKSRFADAINEGISRYPIHRELRFAARMDLQTLFDKIALDPTWNAQRLNANSMILDAESFFVSASGGRSGDYSSCFFNVWAAGIAQAEAAEAALLNHIEPVRIIEPMFSINWNFLTSKRELASAEIEELANDTLYDEAYPCLKEGVSRFIERYLKADESVLVLQGLPGAGKTRLIRAILGEISRQKKDKARALYTGDMRALESDEIFVKFITGWDDAFVIEDADHLLKPRAHGNEHLHRFLSIADGVVRSQGRLLIFSTFLPNVSDLDDALIRPGRCFARVSFQKLVLEEAQMLSDKLCKAREMPVVDIDQALPNANKKRYSLAEIYKAINSAQAAQSAQ